MMRITVCFIAVLLGLAVAGPAVRRTKKDIEDFVKYLDKVTKVNRSEVQAQIQAAPSANPEELSGHYQGDIVLDHVDYETVLVEYSLGRSAYTTSSITTWPNNTVIFEFGDGEFDDLQKAAIWAAAKDIEAHTCVKFRYREPTDEIYVYLTGVTDGCYSHIGYRVSRGAHTMNLGRSTIGTGCFRYATIIHEFMHILGFTHMHATYNRDDYVKIVEENVLAGYEHNFDIYSESTINNYDVEYEYDSCLHYPAVSYSRNGLPTIVALKEHQGEMGQRNYITDNDWLRINRHYDCPGAWD